MNLERRARRITRLFRISAETQVRIWFATRLILVVGGVAMVSIAQFLDSPVEGVPWNKVMGFVGGGLAFAGGVLDLFTTRTTPDALNEAREALEDARQAQSSMANIRRDIAAQTAEIAVQYRRLQKLLGFTSVLREAVERAVTNRAPVETDINRLLGAICRPLLGALGCEGDERWTLNVYFKTGRTLRSIAFVNADRTEATTSAREWAPGEGYVGACYSSEHEIILADAQSPEALKMLNVPARKQRPEDAVHYRSVAAVPIRIAGRVRPWGVVVATSDRLRRFDSDPQGVGAMGAQAVRLLAGMIAILVASDSPASGAGRNRL